MLSVDIYGSLCYTDNAPLETLIEGWGLPKEEQLWKRKDLPLFFDDVDIDKDGNAILNYQQQAFAAIEVERCKKGFWFYNNGIPTFITGKNYFYLQWWKLEDDIFPEYRDADRRYFLFLNHWEHVLWNIGVCRGKKRREGASSQATANLIYECIFFTNSNCGLVSKTQVDSRDTFTDMAAFGYHQLPVFLKPRQLNRADSVTELVFAARIIKGENASKRGNRSKINYRAPVENAYDRGRMTRVLADECFGIGTKILCEGFVFKNVEDIKVGDKVIVEGGKTVEVYKTVSGIDEMFLIKQPYSKDYIVSSRHRLYLERRNAKKKGVNGISILTPSEFINLDKYSKRTTYGIRSKGLQYHYKEVPISPYILGTWLGDGFTGQTRWIVNTQKDPEILVELESYAKEKNYKISYHKTQTDSATRISLSNGIKRWKKSDLAIFLQELGIYKEKRIPAEYLYNSTEIRRQLLAGIIDTDGSKSKDGVIEIGMSRKELVEDIALLARSIGLSVGKIKEKATNFLTKAYRITISGDLHQLPMRLPRKQFTDFKKQYAFRRNRIEVSSIGFDKYFGITLKADNDDDRRLILEDFTISLNCGKWPLDVKASKFISKVSKTMIKGAKRVGYMEVPSTVNELTKGGGAEFKIIWDNANQFKSGGKKTPNRLVTYFTPAYDNYEGFIDKFGFSVIDAPTEEQYEYLVSKWVVKDPITGETVSEISEEDIKLGARAYIYSRRVGLEGELLEEEIRQNPCTVQEMFEAANTDCAFNSYNINQRKKELEEKPIYKRKVIFERKEDQTVEFRDVEEKTCNFFWKLTQIVDPKEANKFYYDGRLKKPGRAHDGAIAVDSYSNSQGGRKYGSKASAWIGRKLDIADPDKTGKPIGHLYGRPAEKGILHEQVLLAAEYFGYPVWYEFTADDYLSYFRERGKDGYLGLFPLSTIEPIKRAKAERYKGFPITPFSLTKQLDSGISYFNHHCDKIDFEELLDNALIFNPYDRTAFDTVVSFLMLIVCLYEPVFKSPPRKAPLVRVFSNN